MKRQKGRHLWPLNFILKNSVAHLLQTSFPNKQIKCSSFRNCNIWQVYECVTCKCTKQFSRYDTLFHFGQGIILFLLIRCLITTVGLRQPEFWDAVQKQPKKAGSDFQVDRLSESGVTFVHYWHWIVCVPLLRKGKRRDWSFIRFV